MTEWRDYVITEVSYDSEHRHIVAVRGYQRPIMMMFGPPFGHTRDGVISNIQKGSSYCTAVRDEQSYSKGEDVIIVSINGRKYIKTEPNNTESDNLGELPEF